MPVLRSVIFPSRLTRVLAICVLLAIIAGLHRPEGLSVVPDALLPRPDLLGVAQAVAVAVALWVALGGLRRTADLLAPMFAAAIAIIDAFARTQDTVHGLQPDVLALDALAAVLAVTILATVRERLRRPASRAQSRPLSRALP